MKLRQIIALAGCAVSLLASQLARAQGVVTYLDNTSQPIGGSNEFGLVGFQFQTGTNAGGYTLNSIQLLFADARGNPYPGLIAYVTQDLNGSPGNWIEVFQPVANPEVAGIYTFMPSTNPAYYSGNSFLTNSANFWMFIGNTIGSSSGSYALDYANTAAAAASDGWFITGRTGIGQIGIPMFSINATPVPEPSTFALLVVALAISSLTRKSIAAPAEIRRIVEATRTK